MLILKRKIGESLVLGEDVEITILEKDGDTIKIGIEAPRSVRVYRKEIFDEIKQANQTAMQTALPGLEELRQLYRQNLKKEDK